MNNPYYFITYKLQTISEDQCIGNCVISENPAKLLKRNLVHLNEHHEHILVIIQWEQITEEQYNDLKEYNTTVESYIIFKDSDYGKSGRLMPLLWE